MQTAFERPFKPIELTSSVIEGFDLRTLSQQLMAEDPFTEHGRNALTLVRSQALTIVLTVAKAGKTIAEHTPPGPATVIGISGSCTLATANDQTKIELTDGTIAAFAPDVVHYVEAHRDSAFLIVIGSQA